MNENKIDSPDIQLIISESDASLGQEANLNYFPQGQEPEPPGSLSSNKEGTDLPPSETLEEDHETILVQEGDERAQAKELLLSSSDDVILSPSSLEAEQETELDKEKKINRCLKSTIKGVFSSYCEISTVACSLRERWVFLLSVLICSKAALEVKNMEILMLRLFLIFACCLVYQMIENMLQYRFLRAGTNSRSEKGECLFDFADKAIILLFLAIFNLQHYGLVNAWFLGIPPFFFLLEILMYRRRCLLVGSQDDVKMATRIFYLLQSFMIALKITHVIDLSWKTTLGFLLVYLALNGVYAIFAALLLVAVCLTSLLNLDTQTLSFLRARILGYIWHIGCYMINIAGLIILLGFFNKIHSNDDETLGLGLEFARILSIFLVTFSALLLPILKKQDFNIFQGLGTALQNQVIRPKKYAIVKTEEQRREAFFLMISSTYFSLLRGMTQEKFKEMILQKDDTENPPKNKEEGSLCYICESRVSNAILVECGHGGVCCECALKLVEQKNECMECRKPATAIYRIKEDSTYKLEAIVQANQLVEIIEI